MKLKTSIYILAVLIVVFAMMTQEVEARRKILKGRKTITRTYFREPSVPAWAIILIVAIVQLIIGGVAFLVMKKFIVDYKPTPKAYN